MDIAMNSTAYLNIFADHVHSFMAIMIEWSFMNMITFSREMHLATVLNRSQIGLQNISQNLSCFRSELYSLILTMLSICGLKLKDHLEV